MILLLMLIGDNVLVRIRNYLLESQITELQNTLIILTPAFKQINKTLDSLTIPQEIRRIDTMKKKSPVYELESFFKQRPLYVRAEEN